MGKIKFFVRRSYGNDRAYLTDEVMAAAWRRLSGRQTLLPQDLKDLKLFGADFERTEEPESESKFKEAS